MDDMLNTKKVLVAEDETDARNLFCNIVEKCGFTAIEARDGEEAIEMVNTWDKDINAIILDIKMPKMHGYQVMEKLKEMHKEIPIIICTAYSSLRDDAVMSTYANVITMEKPISLTELKHNLEELVLTPR
ncbi:MAG: response regulator [Candidatus Omnitrophota bacterium]